MIDTQTETVLPFSQAAKRIPSLRSGRPVSPATLWRWSSVGCLARDGQRVRLETVRIGGSTCTSLEALQRFFARLTGEEAPAQPAPRPAGERHAAAVKRLETSGIG
jgi:hypothetical protein